MNKCSLHWLFIHVVYWFAHLRVKWHMHQVTFKASITIDSLFHKAQTVPLILISCFVTCAWKAPLLHR